MMLRKDPFKILGIDRDNYKYEDLKKVYLELVKKFPPEKRPDKFEEIRSAYDLIRHAKSPYDLMAIAPVSMSRTNLTRQEIAAKFEEDLGIKDEKIKLKKNMILSKLEEITNDTRD
jgi:DnaJ-class molecular chaperone